MTYDWYNLFNIVEFMDSGLVSRSVQLELEGRGVQTFEVFRGNEVSVQYADAFLPVGFLGQNPYRQGAYAIYRDATDNVWFGFEVTA